VGQPAGLLLVTAARLVDYKRLIATVKASRYDAGLVVITALGGVLWDLDKAVLRGIVLSILLFVPRAAKLKAAELTITPERVVRERLPDDPVDPSTVIYDPDAVTILLAGVRPDTLKVLSNIGFHDWFPAEQVFSEEDQEYSATLRAARYTRAKLDIDEPGQPIAEPERDRREDPLYYLV
jgi:SulP family sulfate permease